MYRQQNVVGIWLFSATCLFVFDHISAQCPLGESGPQNFQLRSLIPKVTCAALSVDDCLFVHEAIVKCSCTCDGIIRRGNQGRDDASTRRPGATTQSPPTDDRCRQASDCFQSKSETANRALAELDGAVGQMPTGSCDDVKSGELRKLARDLVREKVKRFDFMAGCVARRIRCAGMPTKAKFNQICNNRRARTKRQAGPNWTLYDEETLAAFHTAKECVPDDACACPEIDVCAQCYQASSSHREVHRIQKQMIILRLQCGLHIRSAGPV